MTNLDLKIGKKIDPNITFYAGDPYKEVMRIDKNGVKVNPEYTVDEATQHVLNALTTHIQHTIQNAIASEREACAKVAWNYGWRRVDNDDVQAAAVEIHDAIRARNT